MNFRDMVRQAKFREVSFWTSSGDLQGGRRTVTHEYPQSDNSFSEDLGRKVRSFPVEGHIVASEYADHSAFVTAKNRIIAALEKFGPGELQHPYHGTRQVIVTGFTVRETSSEVGKAYFSVQFEETPSEPIAPTVVVNAIEKAKESGAAAIAAVGAEFLAKYSPGTLMDDVEENLRKATLAINKAIGTVQMAEQEAALFRRQIDLFTEAISTAINTPADVLSGLGDLFALFPAGSGAALLEVYGYDTGDDPAGSTTAVADAQANFDSMYRLVQGLALTQAATLLPDETFDSYEDAVYRRSRVTDLLDEQSELVSDDTYVTLVQLRADLVNAVPGAGSDLAHLVSYTPPVTVPSLVLAHRLYGSVSREADIVARNGIENPLLVRGGTELEVLSDDK